MTNLILLAAAAAVSPATAQPAAPATLDAWVVEVNRLLERHVHMPRGDDRGIATIAFRRDENGRPVDIVAKSGSPFLTSAAIATVRSIKALPPLPAMMPGNHRITFKLLVGAEGNTDEYERARVAMLGSAKRTNVALAAQFGSATQLAAVSRR